MQQNKEEKMTYKTVSTHQYTYMYELLEICPKGNNIVLLYFHIHNLRVYIPCYNCYDPGICDSAENSYARVE